MANLFWSNCYRKCEDSIVCRISLTSAINKQLPHASGNSNYTLLCRLNSCENTASNKVAIVEKKVNLQTKFLTIDISILHAHQVFV